ncbi:MAG: deoxyribose-phosphate aldolase [Chitinivibrionales bacterium]|nr:deoxyribose-phosphate aldolase [Chitinivibrionales bacterium]
MRPWSSLIVLSLSAKSQPGQPTSSAAEYCKGALGTRARARKRMTAEDNQRMSKHIAAIAGVIDHAILDPSLTDAAMEKELEFARDNALAAVFIKPYAVTLAADILQDCPTAVGTVVGFPQGCTPTDIKVHETHLYCARGATEIDMVVPIGKVLGEEWSSVEQEFERMRAATHQHAAVLKVIFETDYIHTEQHLRMLCRLCSECEVDYVKTSTGFAYTKRDNGSYASDGARDRDIEFMRRHCEPEVKVKAAGGIRTLERLLRLRELGADRIGTSSTKAILDEARTNGYS